MRLWHSVSSAGSSSIVLRPKECQLISCVSHLERQIEAVMKVHLDRLMLVRVLMQLLIYRIFKATNARSNLLLGIGMRMKGHELKGVACKIRISMKDHSREK